MNDQFQRILNLVRHRSNGCYRSRPWHVYVVMDIDQYQALVDFEYKRPQSWATDQSQSNKSQPRIWDTMKPSGEPGQTWNLSQLNPDQLQELERQFSASQTDVVASSVPPEVQTEVPKPIPSPVDDGFGEEQFYLEPIE